MARYNTARFGMVEVDKRTKFYKARDQVEINTLLKRERMFEYHEGIGDYDLLVSNLDMFKLDSLSCATVTIPIELAGRPDLLANLYYSDSDYYWVIMLRNRLENWYDIIGNMLLQLPIKSEIDGLLQDMAFNKARAKYAS